MKNKDSRPLYSFQLDGDFSRNKRIKPVGSYDVALVCLNGHEINSFSHYSPEHNTKYCEECGEPTIDVCQECDEPIRGNSLESVVLHWTAPKHCHNCGKPYPWMKRKTDALAEAIDELDEMSESERGRLKESIPDLIQETPKTSTAITRFKKAITKGGAVGGKLLTDILSKVAAEVVVKSLDIK